MSGALAVILTGLGILNAWSQERLFAVLAVASLWVLVIRTFYRYYQLCAQMQPHFEVMGHKDLNGCVEPISNGDGKYLRLIVTNLGKEAAKNCSAFIYRVTKDAVTLMDNNKWRITFVPGHLPEGIAKTISDTSSEYLDVLVAWRRTGVVCWATNPPEPALRRNGLPLFNEYGTYLLWIEIVGDKAPTKRLRAEFVWAQNFDLVEVRAQPD
jgi:hypothetical protein